MTIGEGHGNPLQYSCLENPMDRGAWWAAVHGVAQSRTWLKRLSSSSSILYCIIFPTTENIHHNFFNLGICPEYPFHLINDILLLVHIFFYNSWILHILCLGTRKQMLVASTYGSSLFQWIGFGIICLMLSSVTESSAVSALWHKSSLGNRCFKSLI